MENIKKINIKVLGIIASVLIIGILISIYFLNTSKNTNSIPYNNPKKLATTYVESILSADFSKTLKCMYLPQDTFINKEDVEKYFQDKSFYKDIDNMKIKNIIETGYNNYQFTLCDKDDNTFKYNVEIVERTKNDYRVNEKDAYFPKFRISVPKNTQVYINNMLVEETYRKSSNEYDDEFVIPGIAKNTKTIKLENKLGTKEYEILADKDNNNLDLTIELKDEELIKKARNFVKDAWNTMYREYVNGSDTSKIRYLFDEKNTDDTINKYYKNGFNKIKEGTSKSSENINYSISEIVKGNDDNYILSDDIIDISFGYKLEWKWHVKGYKSGVNKNMRRYSGIRLKIVDNTFKIYDILDSGLFTVNNEYMKEF